MSQRETELASQLRKLAIGSSPESVKMREAADHIDEMVVDIQYLYAKIKKLQEMLATR